MKQLSISTEWQVNRYGSEHSGPHFLRFKRLYLLYQRETTKKASSVPREYSEESLESCSGLVKAVASAIFGEKNYCEQLKLPLALSKQGRGSQTSFLY